MTKEVLQYTNAISRTEKEAVNKSNSLQEKMAKSVDNLGVKYEKLGNQIKEAYANIPSNIPKITTPSASGGSSSRGGSGSSKSSWDIGMSIASSFVNGGSDGLLNRLGKIGGAVTGVALAVKGVEKYIKFDDRVAEEITNKFMKVGDSIIKAINMNPKQILDNAMNFEQIRSTMNVLAKSEEKGAEVFKNATQLAKYTSFTEADTTSMAQFVLKSNLMPTANDLKQMANLASLKPELGAEHVGLAIFSWLNGRTTSLKQNYGISSDILIDYLKRLPDKKDFAKAFTKKGAVGDKEQAFNLLMKYIASNYGNLAYAQSNTLKGRFSTFGDQFKLFGNKLVGINNEGSVMENSAYKKLGDFLGEIKEDNSLTGVMKVFDDFTQSQVVTEFQNTISGLAGSVLDSLQQIITEPNLEKFTGVLNRIGESFKDLLDKANSTDVFDKIVDAVCEAGNTFADMIKKFGESQSFEKFLEDLPELLKDSLEYETAKLKLAMEFKTYIPTITGFMDKLTGFLQKMASIGDAVISANDLSYGDKMELAKIEGRKRYVKDGQTVESIDDNTMIAYLNDRASDFKLDAEDLKRVINVIKTDDKDKYEINVNVAGGKIDEAKFKATLEKVFPDLIDEAYN